MKHKNTNDGRSSSPNILTYWKKVFGVFLLCFLQQFQAQITGDHLESIRTENKEITINKISTDSTQVETQATIYIDSETEISGTDFISGNFEIIEENLSQPEVSDIKKITPQKSELESHKNSAKILTSKITKAVSAYDIGNTESESVFRSIFSSGEVGISPHHYQHHFITLNKSDSIPASFDDENYCLTSLYSAEHRRNFYSTEFSVRPPPTVAFC